MAEHLRLTHERVDDIPLLVGLSGQVSLPEVLDRHLGTHGHHQGLSNGWLATVWLAFILSEGDHRKSSVQDWADRHQQTLERLLGQPIRSGLEFNDDRLGIVLHRLSKDTAWEALEAELWQSTLAVYDLELSRVRLDSTTSYGYHAPTDGGLMQRGHSKDHRPDLPQLKLMAAAAEPAGHLLATAVHPGQAADDPLYTPLIQRVRHHLGRTGLLYVGDSKMAALATRAELVAGGDAYLMPLPQSAEPAAQWAAWIEAAVAAGQPVAPGGGGDADDQDDAANLGGGYELTRSLSATVAGQPVAWTERVQVLRSPTLARRQTEQLERRLTKAAAAIWALTPAPGRGRRQHRAEASLAAAVAQVLARFDVAGLLTIAWQRQETTRTHYVGRGRGGSQRPTRTDVDVRYAITAVERAAAAIAGQTARLGWRILVTNRPAATLPLAQTVAHYRGGWRLERIFHLLKDRPLGLSPLYVRRDDQIRGLTRLLTLAVRLQTLLETQTRRGLAEADEELAGLYPGQPQRTTARPTATRLLTAIAHAEITLTRLDRGPQPLWHLTPLPSLLERVLTCLGLSPSLYHRLAENSS
ncbi:MAG TPA: transposase [Mycobacteriales bacterium]|nr:transposase [Mycobacteriales bacterium]